MTGRLLLLAAFAAAPAPARAGLTLTTNPSSPPPGGTGTFDVTLTVDSQPPIEVAGFGFRLSFGTAGFRFTSVEYGPNYLFDGVSFSQFMGDPGPTPVLNPTTLDANDVVFDANGLTNFVTVSPGQTFTLARIGFAIDPGVTWGTSAGLAFDPVLTTVTLSDGTSLTPKTVVGLVGTAVPEPAPANFLLAAAAGLVVARRRVAGGKPGLTR